MSKRRSHFGHKRPVYRRKARVGLGRTLLGRVMVRSHLLDLSQLLDECLTIFVYNTFWLLSFFDLLFETSNYTFYNSEIMKNPHCVDRLFSLLHSFEEHFWVGYLFDWSTSSLDLFLIQPPKDLLRQRGKYRHYLDHLWEWNMETLSVSFISPYRHDLNSCNNNEWLILSFYMFWITVKNIIHNNKFVKSSHKFSL